MHVVEIMLRLGGGRGVAIVGGVSRCRSGMEVEGGGRRGGMETVERCLLQLR